MEEERRGQRYVEAMVCLPLTQQSQVSLAVGFCLKSLVALACFLICAARVLGRLNSLLTFRRVTLHSNYLI